MSQTRGKGVKNSAKLQRKKKRRAKRRMQILLLFAILILTAVGIWAAINFVSEYNRKNTFEYQYNEALRLYADGSYDKALGCLNKALEMDDAGRENIQDAIELKYLVLVGKKSYDEAIGLVLQMIEDAPSESLYYQLMELYSLTGKYDQMEILANRLAGTEFNNVYTEYMVGSISADQKSGIYNSAVKIELTASKADLIIHYTLDGSAPTLRSNIYSEPIEFSEEGSYTVRAIGINSNGMESEEMLETYTVVFLRPDKPDVLPETGVYSEKITISIENISEGSTVYYTLDGSIPTVMSDEYTEPFVLPEGNYILNVIAIDGNGTASDVVWRIYEYLPDLPYSYGAALIKVKKALIEKGIMTDMDGNTEDGTVIRINLIGITSNIGDKQIPYYVFQITSEYNDMWETLSGYHLVSADDGDYFEADSVDMTDNTDSEGQEEEQPN